MRDLDRIRFALEGAAGEGHAVMLVTVLGVQGSVYRGAGARMLVLPQGQTIGAVSGGCLEADIVARAPEVLEQNAPEVVRYDTRASDDVVLGLGLGCQGVIDVLMEPLAGEKLSSAAAFYSELASHRNTVRLLTVTDVSQSGSILGLRAVTNESGEFIHGDAAVLTCSTGVTLEVIKPATKLVICGAGTDAMPVARIAAELGWIVTVADHRPALLTAARFPASNRRLIENDSSGTSEPSPLDLLIDSNSAVLVMAHSAMHDGAYLKQALSRNAAYIGVLGPRRRTLELLGGSGDMPMNVYAPVGLDIGAESPEEIALAMVAEIAAVFAGRSGKSLRERQAPIHDARQGTLTEAR